MFKKLFSWIKSLFIKQKKQVEAIENTHMTEPHDGMQFIVGKIENANEYQRKLTIQSIERLAKIFKSDYFKESILNGKFTGTNGLTNEQILDKILNTIFTVNVSWFYGTWYQNRIAKTVGYDNEDDFVHVNSYFVDDEQTLSSLIAHELMHSIGFSHQSASDYKSVPYSMNEIIENYKN